MNNLNIIISILLLNPLTNAWSGILMDSSSLTQLYFPNRIPHTAFNLSFGLPHLDFSRAVMLNGVAYFINGYDHTTQNGTNKVTVFNPATNMSTVGIPTNTPRIYHAATVVNNKILIC